MKQQIAEFWIAVTHDKKKASVLAALAIVALALWVRASLLSQGPQKARGAEGGGAGASHDAGGGGADGFGASGSNVGVTLPPVEPLSRDFFAPSERFFPNPSQTDALAEETPKYPAGNDETSDRLREQREAIVRSVKERAGRLKLRSIVVGARPNAVIESPDFGKSRGKVFSVGDVVDGLTLVEIHSDRVVLEGRGVRVQLHLQLQSEL